MTKTEQLAKEWLLGLGYTEDQILFQSRHTPDFLLSDGRSIEVKKVQTPPSRTVRIYGDQWERLQMQPDCSIAIFSEISAEPLAVIKVSEVNPPLFKKNGYVVKIVDDGMANWRRHLRILEELRNRQIGREEFWKEYYILKNGSETEGDQADA